MVTSASHHYLFKISITNITVALLHLLHYATQVVDLPLPFWGPYQNNSQ